MTHQDYQKCIEDLMCKMNSVHIQITMYRYNCYGMMVPFKKTVPLKYYNNNKDTRVFKCVYPVKYFDESTIKCIKEACASYILGQGLQDHVSITGKDPHFELAIHDKAYTLCLKYRKEI